MIEEKYINLFNELKKEKTRPKKICEFCGKKYGNVKYHQHFCSKNPNRRKAERCSYCNKFFISLGQHILKCKHRPEKDLKPVKHRSHTIYISLDLIISLCKNDPNISARVKTAISHKIEKDEALPMISEPYPQSISLDHESYKKIQKIIDKGWNLSFSEFVRQAIIDEVRQNDDK